MTFVSYAQNFEDVLLWRALKGIDQGFYIDVGANDPITDSVTKAFYDAGWRGINIEPSSEWFEKLQQARSDDTNLQVAVGARKGNINFYEIPGTGLSTSDHLIAKQHARRYDVTLEKKKVQVVRLTTICEQYVPSDIHFLKIDVEGAEKSVLQGINLQKIRPWIILVESTLPGTEIEAYEDWEPSLLAADYEYIKFDGLNRFYLAKEHRKIRSSLIAPPNVFDDFVLSGTGSSSFHAGVRSSLQKAELKCQALHNEREVLKHQIEELNQSNNQWWSMADRHSKELIEVRAELAELNNTSKHWCFEADRLNTELQDIYNSNFWAITKPLRIIMQFLKKLLFLAVRIARRLTHLLKRLARWSLIKARGFVLKHPKVGLRVKNWLKKYPNLYRRLEHQTAQSENLGQLESGSRGFGRIESDVEQSELESSMVTASLKWVTEKRLNV